MSASREKKNRQVQNESGYVNPAQASRKAEDEKTRKSNRIYAIGAAAFLVLAVVLFVWNSGITVRGKDAVSIDGESYSVGDFSYYFGEVFNEYAPALQKNGLDLEKSLRDQKFAGDESWFDYFADIALDRMANVIRLTNAAAEEGFTDDETLDKTEKEVLDIVDAYAASYGYSRHQFLKLKYGKYLTEKNFVRQLRLSALAGAYASSHADSLNFSDQEIQAEYDANPAAYDYADIEILAFSSDSAPADDAAKEAALSENHSKAEEAVARAAAGEKLEELAGEMGGDYNHLPYSSSGTASPILSWAFASERRSGDAAAIDMGETRSCAVVFNGRSRSDYHTVTVRHILVDDAETAETLLKQFEAGAGTEEDFASLAAANTKDSASVETGGLYEDVYRGQMVVPFEDWSFDPSRKSGDTGIVETDYGYHIMYFVETNPLPCWQYKAELSLRQQATAEWNETLGSENEPEMLDGMKYIG